MTQSFDPKKIEAVFTLTAAAKENVRLGAINAAMANLVKALEFYITSPMLKKEKDLLEQEFFDTISKLAKHPKFTGAFGPVSFRRGEHKENIDFLKQLIKFAADTVQQKIEQGIELMIANRFAEAHALFWEVLDDPDAEMQHFLTIGDAFLERKRWPEAQEVFTRALARDPNSVHVINRMAISFRKDKKFSEALNLYRKALLLSPQDEGIYYNVARLFLDMGNPKNAGQALRKALSINPKFAPAAKLLVGVQEALAAGPAPGSGNNNRKA